MRMCGLHSRGVEREFLEGTAVALPQLELTVLRLREDLLPVSRGSIVQAEPAGSFHGSLCRGVAPARLRRVIARAGLHDDILPFVSTTISGT